MPPITITKENNNNSNDRPNPRPNTYTAIPNAGPEKDLESIGKHCDFPFCHQLDFLPFRCESCHNTFCLDHRSEVAHKCPKEGEWARRNASGRGTGTGTGTGTGPGAGTEKPTIYNSDQCAEVSCKTLINTLKDPGVKCPECRREFCLKHRLKEEHDCRPPRSGLAGRRVGGATGGGPDTIRSMFSKVRTWGKDKSASTAASLTPKPKPNSASARAAEINSLKRTAKGEPSIPGDKRVYLRVEGTNESQKGEAPKGQFFFDRRWKVGRVLDDAAKRLNVQNMNNRGGGEETRLRVFHVDRGVFLEFSDPVGEKVGDGDTVVLLRGAGELLGKD